MFRKIISGMGAVSLMLAALVACTPTPQMNLLEINQKIEKSLTDLAVGTKAVRIVVRQFHAGEMDFLGTHEIVVSEQYIYEGPGFALFVQQGSLNNVPLSTYQPTVKRMWKEDGTTSCFVYNTEDLAISQLRAFLELHRVVQVAGCPILEAGTNKPIGILSLSFWEKTPPESHDRMLTDTNRAAKQIANYLGDKRGTRHQIL